MIRIIQFTKYRFVMIALSLVLILGGIIGTVLQGGFNLGIDFQAGLSQRVQIAEQGFSLAYSGPRAVTLDIRSNTVVLEVRGEDGVTEHRFSFRDYPTLMDLVDGLSGIEGIGAALLKNGATPVSDITIGMNIPAQITAVPLVIHVATSNIAHGVSIDQVRQSLAPLGEAQIQVVGRPAAQEYLVRIKDEVGDQKTYLENQVRTLLGGSFGEGNIVVKQSDYVGPRFSRDIAGQVFYLTGLALLLILIYIWFRFKLAYAVSAIIALVHDVAFMIGVIGTFQLEVSTGTIAAVLTIIGYSLNDTIVVFDRIRENTGIMRESTFKNIVNTSITQSLSRTLMTSFTTLLAVLALYFFGTGMIKAFSFNLIIGILVGTYSSIFIASPVLLGWISRTRSSKRKQDEKTYGKAEALPEKEENSDAVQPAEKQDIKPVVVPQAQRKLKGKRQQQKKKK